MKYIVKKLLICMKLNIKLKNKAVLALLREGIF